ncbi:MAG: S1 RNA-binding domain-containing protein, partial [Lentisphaeria bacterium]|nr:S1 RNA-binding domain-containing protein [Lentisphaeria bacterium]
MQENKFEDAFLDFSGMPASMEDLLKTTEETAITKGKIVKGKVAQKRPDGALIDIGYKAEGFVAASEFMNYDDINVGDEIDVYLEEIENRQNMPTLSLEKAYSIKAWDRITTEYGEGHIVKGIMRHKVKGGVMVDVEGFPAFLPGSQLDVGPVRNIDDYI